MPRQLSIGYCTPHPFLNHHRGDRNALRQITRRQTSAAELEVIRFSVAVRPIASVVLVIYSDHPHDFQEDTPIHGIGAGGL